MSYTSSHYICVNRQKFYAFNNASDCALSAYSSKKLAYTVGNATYYVPLSNVSGSGIRVNVGGTVYSAINLAACIYLHTCTKTVCLTPWKCVDTCLRTYVMVGGYYSPISIDVFTCYRYSSRSGSSINSCGSGYWVGAGNTSNTSGTYRASGLCAFGCNCFWNCAIVSATGSGHADVTVQIPYATTAGQTCTSGCTFQISSW